MIITVIIVCNLKVTEGEIKLDMMILHHIYLQQDMFDDFSGFNSSSHIPSVATCKLLQNLPNPPSDIFSSSNLS